MLSALAQLLKEKLGHIPSQQPTQPRTYCLSLAIYRSADPIPTQLHTTSSKTPRSTRLFSKEDNPTSRLEFLGYGISRQEMLEVISFGHSDKMTINIGRYGNKLKSGAFYLGQEVMVLTKKDKRKLPKPSRRSRRPRQELPRTLQPLRPEGGLPPPGRAVPSTSHGRAGPVPVLRHPTKGEMSPEQPLLEEPHVLVPVVGDPPQGLLTVLHHPTEGEMSPEQPLLEAAG